MNKHHTKEGVQEIIDKYPEEAILHKLGVKWLQEKEKEIIVSEEEFQDYASHLGMKVKEDLGIMFWGKVVRRPYEKV